MSRFVSTYSKPTQRNGEMSSFRANLATEMPELISAMAGSYNLEGQCVMPPCTLMLFLEEDRMGFCLSPKGGGKCAFGSLPDPSKGLLGVEAELQAGHFEWKQKRTR